MGWERRDKISGTSSEQGSPGIDGTEASNFDSGDLCSTRRIVRSQCKTEEVEPGKFVRKCEKTEQVFKDCVGRPAEVVQSNTEYTEDDVTDEMTRGSVPFESPRIEPFNFPGLRSDVEAIERSVFGGINQFLDAVEEMKNGFFQNFGDLPHYDKESSPSSRRGIPIERSPPRSFASPPKQKNEESPFSDFAGQFKDV